MGELGPHLTIGFGEGEVSDVLGGVYGISSVAASAEGKKVVVYTPAHVVKTLVAVLAPRKVGFMTLL